MISWHFLTPFVIVLIVILNISDISFELLGTLHCLQAKYTQAAIIPCLFVPLDIFVDETILYIDFASVTIIEGILSLYNLEISVSASPIALIYGTPQISNNLITFLISEDVI